MTRRSVWSAVVLFLAILAVAPGCSLKEDFKAEVRGYLQHTETLARAYVYNERHNTQQRQLAVKIADDLTYSVDYSLNGQPEVSEVAVDDNRALRVADPSLLKGVVAPAAAPTPAASPSPGASPAPAASPAAGGVSLGSAPAGNPAAAAGGTPESVLASLRNGQWVIDPSGASSLSRYRPRGPQPQIGDDPVNDALDVLNYFDLSLDLVNSAQVVKFSPESGGYFRDLDPFPWPAAGVTRYDINSNPQLPPRSALQSQTNQARQNLVNLLPYFKSQAVYVRNGVVIAVRESIDVSRRLRLPDQDILQRLSDGQVKVPAGMASAPLGSQSQFIVSALNRYYASQGLNLLRERQLDVQFTFGARPQVTLPPADTRGSLAGLFQRGQILGGASA